VIKSFIVKKQCTGYYQRVYFCKFIQTQNMLNNDLQLTFHSCCLWLFCADIRLNVVAVNPFSGRTIPLFIQTSHDFGENLDAHVGK